MGIVKQATKKVGRQRKEQIVAQLIEKIDASQAIVFTDYQGITHKQLEDLKKELKKLDSSIVIAKNSLLKISLGKSKNFADYKDNENLDKPTATLFIRADYVEPLKKLQKLSKELGLPKIKFGIIDGQALDEAQVLKVASLPNKETLIGQFVGLLNSPIQGLVVTLNAPLQKFAMTLNAIAQNKPAQSAAPVSEPVAPAAESTPSEITEETTTDAAEQPSEEKPAESTQAPSEAQTETPSETENQTEENKGGEN